MLIQAQDFFNQGNGIVTLCGSTEFFFEFQEATRQLTFSNWIVLTCGSWGHSMHKYDASTYERDYEQVKKLHFHKILMSQAVVICHGRHNKYYGDSTKAEIAFSQWCDIPIFEFQNGELIGSAHIREVPTKLDYTVIIDRFAEQNSLGF